MHSAVTTLPARRQIPVSVSLPLMVAAFCILWSSAFAVAKMAVAECPPLLLLTVRFLAAGLLVLGLARLSGGTWTLTRRDVFLFAVLGIANQALYLGLGYVGLRDISAGLSIVIASANPIVIAFLAVMLLGERMTWRKLIGLLLGFGGVVFIVSHRLSLGTEGLRGILFTVASLLSLVGGTVLFKKFAPKDGFWIGNGVQSLAAGFALLPFAFTFESVSDVIPSWRLLAAFAYLVFAVSAFAYLLWFQILKIQGATAASSYHFLMPPLGMLFGWLLLGEHVAAADLFGIIPVVVGIYLVTRSA
jgi:drug/metabolite transporter (DMT)-like permease